MTDERLPAIVDTCGHHRMERADSLLGVTWFRCLDCGLACEIPCSTLVRMRSDADLASIVGQVFGPTVVTRMRLTES